MTKHNFIVDQTVIYQPSFQVVTLHLTFSSTGCESAETQTLLKDMSSPRNESMERADLTMEDWIHETCLILAVTSGPTEPKTFQEAWHYPVENKRNNWRAAIWKEIRNMINRGVWRKTDRAIIKRTGD